MVLKWVSWIDNTKSGQMVLKGVNRVHNDKTSQMVIWSDKIGSNVLKWGHNDNIRSNGLERIQLGTQWDGLEKYNDEIRLNGLERSQFCTQW